MSCAPVTDEQAVKYLHKYGYLKPAQLKSSASDKPEDIETQEDGVKKFQKMAGIEETGELDKVTLDKMGRPRCGVEDIAEMRVGGEYKWERTDLTFSIDNFWNRTTSHHHMSKDNIRKAIRTAFDAYSAVTPLTFTEVPHGTGDIKLIFAEKHHGDQYPFDGKGGALAHAFYPADGSVHFDSDETWTIMNEHHHPDNSQDFLTTAIHEIGHSLGIMHEDVHGKESIMSPIYGQPRDTHGSYLAPKLDEHVVSVLHQKYGAATQQPHSKGPHKENHDCTKNVYAVLSFPGHGIMLFPNRGTRVMVFNGHTRKSQQYVPIADIFSSGPANVTAAYYSWERSMFMLFHGNKVWGYKYDVENRSVTLADGYPKTLPVNDDWQTGAAMYSEPESVLVSYAKMTVNYNERTNEIEEQGHIRKVYPNMPEGVVGTAMIRHGEFPGFTQSKIFKYDYETQVTKDLGLISDFVQC